MVDLDDHATDGIAMAATTVGSSGDSTADERTDAGPRPGVRKTSSTVCASISPMRSPPPSRAPAHRTSPFIHGQSAAPTLRVRVVHDWNVRVPVGQDSGSRIRVDTCRADRQEVFRVRAISGQPSPAIQSSQGTEADRPMAPSSNAGRDRVTPPDRAWRSASWTSWRPSSSPPRRSFGGEGAR